MHMVGQISIPSRRAVIPTRHNPAQLWQHLASPPPQQPNLDNRVCLAIRHQETPESGFPYRYASRPFDLPRMTSGSTCRSGKADSRATLAVGVVKEELSLNKRAHSFTGSA
jgi:hypothetical protein